MFNNKMGRKLSEQIGQIDEKHIREEKVDKMKQIKNRNPTNFQKEFDLEEIPNGTQLFGPTKGVPKVGGSGFAQGSDWNYGFEESKGAKGSGKKKASDKDLWKEIDKAIKGSGSHMNSQVGGGVRESLGNDLMNVAELNKMEGGLKFSSSDLNGIVTPDNIKKIERLAEHSELLVPLLERAPEGKKSKVLEILNNVSSIVRDVAPIVRIMLEMRNGMKGSAKFPQPVQLLQGSYTGGKEEKKRRPTSEWNTFVKEMMHKTGGSMRDTLKYIKEKNLWKKK